MNIGEAIATTGLPTVGEGHRHGRPGWVQIDCPWCGRGSGKFHLGFSLSTGAASCYQCGPHNPAAAIAHATGMSYAAARGLIDGVAYVGPAVRPVGRLRLPVGVRPLADAPAHCNYLRRRGFDPAVIADTWGVGAITAAGRLAWRLFIPIHHGGRVVSWTTRHIGTAPRNRYISAAAADEDIPHKSILYGADHAAHAVIVHEGPLDAWATGPGAVATMGLGYTADQVAVLSRYLVRAICFDATDAAQRRADALADALAPFSGTTYVVRLETGEDAADAEEEELVAVRLAVFGSAPAAV